MEGLVAYAKDVRPDQSEVFLEVLVVNYVAANYDFAMRDPSKHQPFESKWKPISNVCYLAQSGSLRLKSGSTGVSWANFYV